MGNRINPHLWERYCEKGNRLVRLSRPWDESETFSTITPVAPTSTIPQLAEPMQMGRSHLTPKEREKRRKFHLCFYCGENNHNIGQCPLKGQTQQGRGGTCGVRSKVPELPPLSLQLLKFSQTVKDLLLWPLSQTLGQTRSSLTTSLLYQWVLN